MIISNGARKMQLKILVSFSLSFLVLLVCAIVKRNDYFLYPALFVLVIFIPLFSYCLNFYDIAIREGYFLISNLESGYRIRSYLFTDVSPSVTLFKVRSSPFFAIHFFNGARFNFFQSQPLISILSRSCVNAQDLEKEVKSYLEINDPEYTTLPGLTSLTQVLHQFQEHHRQLH
jgi:hypothetical protein